MLRFILKDRRLDAHSGATTEYLYTLDASLPELERELCRGGMGESGYQIVDLVGVEVLPVKEPPA